LWGEVVHACADGGRAGGCVVNSAAASAASGHNG